jgi:Protein of unknown function (DUF3551)
LTDSNEACLLARRRSKPDGRRHAKGILDAVLCCVAAPIGALPGAARDFPFCIKGCDVGGSLGDCSFSSYEQCKAAASGRDAYCDANPYFSAKAEPQSDRARQSRKRF